MLADACSGPSARPPTSLGGSAHLGGPLQPVLRRNFLQRGNGGLVAWGHNGQLLQNLRRPERGEALSEQHGSRNIRHPRLSSSARGGIRESAATWHVLGISKLACTRCPSSQALLAHNCNKQTSQHPAAETKIACCTTWLTPAAWEVASAAACWAHARPKRFASWADTVASSGRSSNRAATNATVAAASFRSGGQDLTAHPAPHAQARAHRYHASE